MWSSLVKDSCNIVWHLNDVQSAAALPQLSQTGGLRSTTFLLCLHVSPIRIEWKWIKRTSMRPYAVYQTEAVVFSFKIGLGLRPFHDRWFVGNVRLVVDLC